MSRPTHHDGDTPSMHTEHDYDGQPIASTSTSTASTSTPLSSTSSSTPRKRPRRSRSVSSDEGESRSIKQQRTSDRSDGVGSAASTPTSTIATTSTGTSPPRRPRQPPLSQAAWTSLRDGASANGNAIPPAPPQIPPPSNPTDIFSRNAPATPLAAQDTLRPPTLPTPLGDAASRIARGALNLPPPVRAPARPANPFPIIPGSLLEALLGDIMGYPGGARRVGVATAQGNTTGDVTNTTPPSGASDGVTQATPTATSTSSVNAPNPASQPATPTPPAPRSGGGGTSILIQGAMVSRLLRRPDNGAQTAPGTSASASEPQQASGSDEPEQQHDVPGDDEQPAAPEEQLAQQHASSAEDDQHVQQSVSGEQPAAAAAASSSLSSEQQIHSGLANDGTSTPMPSVNREQRAHDALRSEGLSTTSPTMNDEQPAHDALASDGISTPIAPVNDDTSTTTPTLDGQAPTTGTTETGTESTEAGTLEEQATMLCRLTSIATAATAASLISGNGATSAGDDPRAADSNHRSTSAQAAGAMAATTPPSSQSAPVQGVRASVSEFLSRARQATRRLLSRRSDSATATGGADFEPFDFSMSDSGLIPSQDDRFDGDDEASIDESIGPAVRIRPSGYEGASDSGTTGSGASASGTTTPSRAAGPARRQPTRTRAGRDMTLSEMIHEAIQMHGTERAGAGERSQAPQSSQLAAAAPSASASTPPPTPLPLHRHLSQVLQTVRENRLATDGAQGSFERWLSDIGGELHYAVRAMADANGIVVSRGEAGVAAAAAPPPHSQPPCRDVAQGQLRFFRLFRFPANAHRQDTRDADMLSTRAPAGLVPCVLVAVNSQPIGRRGGQVGGQTGGGTTAAAAGAATGTTAAEASHAPTGSTTAPPADAQTSGMPGTSHWHESRFNMFVSGGHFSPTHPLLNSTHGEATTDVMNLMRILAAHSHLTNLGRTHGGARTATSPVSAAELKGCAAPVKRWEEIKTVSVSADASREATVSVGTTDSDTTTPALRAGERCNICLEDWRDGDDCRVLGCRHVFHQSCVDEWLTSSSNSCPMCRTVVVQRGGGTAAR